MDTRQVLGGVPPRIIDSVLQEALGTAGAVVIEGPRACGKTMTALHACASYVFLDDADTQTRLQVAPDTILDGAQPRLLDEWQVAPELWNLVRRRVDRTGQPGSFILTGSALLIDDTTRHTGAGRFLRLRQHTMAWAELRPELTAVSLADLFDGFTPPTAAPVFDLTELTTQLTTSGFPALSRLHPDKAARLLRAYLQEITHADLGRLATIRHEPVVIERLLRALARATASETAFQTLRADVVSVAPSITADTVAGYVGLLRQLFVVEQQEAWAPGLRSRARLRTSPRWHLADPALSAAALGATASTLQADLATTGLLFESAVVHDLSVLAAPLEGRVFHYRDSNGYEIDAVVVLPDGRWGAVEVKLGERQVPAGARSLSSAVEQIADRPAFRLVITGTGGTFTLDDETITCPLAVLGA